MNGGTKKQQHMSLLFIDFVLFICVILLFRRTEKLLQQADDFRTDYEIDRTEDKLSLDHNMSDIRYEIESIKKPKSKQVLKG
jgi:hypothetical protein